MLQASERTPTKFHSTKKLFITLPSWHTICRKRWVAVNCFNHNFMIKKSWHFIYFLTKKCIMNVAKNGFKPSKGGYGRYIYARNNLWQVCLNRRFTNVKVISPWGTKCLQVDSLKIVFLNSVTSSGQVLQV